MNEYKIKDISIYIYISDVPIKNYNLNNLMMIFHDSTIKHVGGTMGIEWISHITRLIMIK